MPRSPGRVATCAADGYLRLLDVTAGDASGRGAGSTVVVSPEHGEDPAAASPFRGSLMHFSHSFLSAHVGLVCSERGLLHFDLRLPPRSQRRGSLVPELGGGGCKACYPWRAGGVSGDCGANESAYVFAGGSGVDVGLYDLRMTAGSGNSGRSSQVVQTYRPAALAHAASSTVAVSGLDLSKDGRELLVSYESDHAYTFPVLGGKHDPTLADIEAAERDGPVVSELAAYGGHLNRLTFLKMAKYAGTNDECECLRVVFAVSVFVLTADFCLALASLTIPLCCQHQTFARAATRDTPGSTRRNLPRS